MGEEKMDYFDKAMDYLSKGKKVTPGILNKWNTFHRTYISMHSREYQKALQGDRDGSELSEFTDGMEKAFYEHVTGQKIIKPISLDGLLNEAVAVINRA